MAQRLTGRKLLVTGGASGIGRESAALFRSEGAAVTILDRHEEAVRAVAAEIGADGVNADVSDPGSAAAAVRHAAGTMGGLDGVVNAAGIFFANGLTDTTAEMFSQTLAVNLTGPFLVLQAAEPFLRQAERASVVNIASGVGLSPTGPGSTAYVASKGGLIAMTKALALELAPAIRVNAVCPGAVETPMTAGFLRDAAGRVDPAIANRYALKRPAAASEIAAAILFLISDEASFVSGIALAVDGGRTLH